MSNLGTMTRYRVVSGELDCVIVANNPIEAGVAALHYHGHNKTLDPFYFEVYSRWGYGAKLYKDTNTTYGTKSLFNTDTILKKSGFKYDKHKPR